MAKKNDLLPVVGAWAFFAGLLISLVAGFVFPGQSWVPVTLGIIGVVVGLVNIADKETTTFLIAAIAFNVAASNLAAVAQNIAGASVGGYLHSVFAYAGVFVATAAAIIAIKTIYGIAKSA